MYWIEWWRSNAYNPIIRCWFQIRRKFYFRFRTSHWVIESWSFESCSHLRSLWSQLSMFENDKHRWCGWIRATKELRKRAHGWNTGGKDSYGFEWFELWVVEVGWVVTCPSGVEWSVVDKVWCCRQVVLDTGREGCRLLARSRGGVLSDCRDLYMAIWDHRRFLESIAYMLPRLSNLLARATSSGSTRMFAVWKVEE